MVTLLFFFLVWQCLFVAIFSTALSSCLFSLHYNVPSMFVLIPCCDASTGWRLSATTSLYYFPCKSLLFILPSLTNPKSWYLIPISFYTIYNVYFFIFFLIFPMMILASSNQQIIMLLKLLFRAVVPKLGSVVCKGLQGTAREFQRISRDCFRFFDSLLYYFSHC